jgi:exosortase B
MSLPANAITSGQQPNPLFLGVVGLGLMALYGPTYWTAWNGIWQTDDLGHGPIILAILVWLFWHGREDFLAQREEPSAAFGLPLLILGLAGYVVGRIFAISSMEFASHLPVVAGLLLVLKGRSAVRVLWFPLLYIIFLVPLPGSFVDAITGPLKHWISAIVVELLFLAGYPVGRSGVVITVGQYQLLVADACSGLHSMISLAALGTLFVYLMGRPSRVQNALMVVAIIPIAFIANIFRVMILVLVTYHLGDEAAQGFLHGFAGMVLMILALLLFFALDAVLALVIQGRTVERVRSAVPS